MVVRRPRPIKSRPPSSNYGKKLLTVPRRFLVGTRSMTAPANARGRGISTVATLPRCDFADTLRTQKTSPRIGHLHIHMDDLPWGWVEATSGNNTISVAGLPPGQHKMLVELVDANHHVFAGCA